MRDSYHDDMDGPGPFNLGVDILPTELAREATKHFGDALFPFVGALAGAKDLDAAPEPMKRAAIAADGRLTPLFEYITRMREHQAQRSGKELNGGPFSTVVRLQGGAEKKMRCKPVKCHLLTFPLTRKKRADLPDSETLERRALPSTLVERVSLKSTTRHEEWTERLCRMD